MDFLHRGECLSAAEAKHEFFLSPADLAQLPHTREGGWGNNTRLYERADVVAYALRLHGAQGLQARREKRGRREEKKRSRESEAKEYERRLLAGEVEDEVVILSGSGVAGTAVKKPRSDTASSSAKKARVEQPAAAAAPAPTSAADSAAVSRLLDEARRALKAKLTWDYLHSRNAQHGCMATVTLERVEQRLFAGMVGRGRDPELRSLPKAGAWHTCQLPVEALVGDRGLQGAGGKYGSNAQIRLGGEDCDTLTFKYRPATQTCSITGLVNPMDF